MRFRIATIFAAAALFFAPGANAALTLYLTDGTNSVLATDIGNTGLISFNGPLGSGPWVANVTTGLSKPLLTPIRMDLNSVNVSSTGGGDLTIILADNGSNWYATGAPDERWDNDMLHLLDELTGNDFEAVDTSVIMVDLSSGEVR